MIETFMQNLPEERQAALSRWRDHVPIRLFPMMASKITISLIS